MWARRKNTLDERFARGISYAALELASRDALVHEAMRALRVDGGADRIGVWLEPDSPEMGGAPHAEEFRGEVWDSGGYQTPDEWQRLSLELPLPKDLLLGGNSVEQQFSSTGSRPVFGLLIGLHQILWTPVHASGRLHGLIPVGSQHPQYSPSRERSESVAAELALAMEFRRERSFALERQADLQLQRKLLEALTSGASPDSVLAELTASCTEFSDAARPLASFAVIGHLPRESPAVAAPEMEFCWESGDTEWTHAVERDPLAAVWRQSLVAGRVIGVEPPSASRVSRVVRLVANPLGSEGKPIGVLVAGIPPHASSMQNLERLGSCAPHWLLSRLNAED
jgi:hypothetical protein